MVRLAPRNVGIRSTSANCTTSPMSCPRTSSTSYMMENAHAMLPVFQFTQIMWDCGGHRNFGSKYTPKRMSLRHSASFMAMLRTRQAIVELAACGVLAWCSFVMAACLKVPLPGWQRPAQGRIRSVSSHLQQQQDQHAMGHQANRRLCTQWNQVGNHVSAHISQGKT